LGGDPVPDVLVHAACFFGALVLMEAVAYYTHKHVMHGSLWALHRSHHEPRQGRFERNDLFAIFFATPSIVLIYLGTHGYPWALSAGLGVAGYGLVYFVFHDIIVHRRIAHDWRPSSRYLQRIVHAHRLHHATSSKDGAVSFGFVYAPPVRVLREEMKAIEAQRRQEASNAA
jgi:beta-carotene 3-hydroxylase